ncbi:hypothetical protein KUTeg_015475 [Tegillarca granosa]|uniref:Uncharacterized protein n=1 Tax=Tegillarca granosa TaxID=220873 RepID=A0ABQ9ETW3_TEGGR|nr:hypothetical protein KUTeg_015475 [Tegillarca granosa]
MATNTINKRQKRMDREAFLQWTILPDNITTAFEPLLKAKSLLTQHFEHWHGPMTFTEPRNKEVCTLHNGRAVYA